jgi:hypothetical protein
MLRFGLALAACGLCFTTARAEETPPAKNEAPETPAAPAAPSSQDVRATQNANVALRNGFMYTLVPGAGIEGNVILDKSFQVGASINAGFLHAKAEANSGRTNYGPDDDDDDDDDDKTSLDKANIRAKSFAAYGRWFPFNSLYVLAGMSYRVVDSEMQISDAADDANYVNVQSSSKAICLDGAIGNVWSWESGFFIGGEWFGLSVPLWAKSDTDVDTGGVPTGEVEKESDRSKKFVEQIGKGTSLRLAVLHVGWAF